jgi:DNA-binding transcriptional LysR family regulator
MDTGDGIMFISYDYYRIFYYVAKYGSFSQAANVLLGSQPNITRAIKNLENELGCVLFVRTNKGVSLTPEGERLFEHISLAYDHIHSAEEELTAGKGLESGTVTVGASETALHGIIIPTLKRFMKSYPGIKIHISNHSTPQAISALKSGLVDFCVVTTPTGVFRPLKETKLKPFRELFVCGPKFRHLCATPFELENIASYPYIGLGKTTKTFEFFNTYFSERGVTVLPDMEVATTDQILPLIKNDFGLGFLPDIFANEYIEKGEIFNIPLREEIPPRWFCLVKDKERPLSIAARELEKYLLEGSEK